MATSIYFIIEASKKCENTTLQTQPAITCSKLTIETLEQGTYFTPCSSVSIVDFEQVHTG